jgi:superfamily II DNA or RNA helicase
MAGKPEPSVVELGLERARQGCMRHQRGNAKDMETYITHVFGPEDVLAPRHGEHGCQALPRNGGLMRAVIAGTIAFRAEHCPPLALERLRRDLSFPNPEYVSRRRMHRQVDGVPQRIHCLNEHRDGSVEIPRGAVDLLRKRLAETGAALDFEDRRVLHPRVDFASTVDLRPYQETAVQKMLLGVQGTVVMPCGGGKTVAGTAAISAVGQPTLVIVHTHDLLEQWSDTVRRILDIEPGIVAEGACAPSTVTVATVQTLVRLSRERLSDLASGFGCVIVDEAHHAPANTFQAVLNLMPARYRFGLTATPRREDGLTPLLDFTLGRRLFDISYADLVGQGFLNSPEVRPVYSSFSFDGCGSEDHHACLSALVSDSERNELVAELAAKEARDGHSVLVLSGRVEHCRVLAGLIARLGTRAEVLVSAVKKPERSRILEELRSGVLPVVVASTLADEGLDVPRLDRIVLAFPGRSTGRTTQRLGRLMRPHPKKKNAVLFDIVDAAVPSLLRQYRERSRIYQHLVA